MIDHDYTYIILLTHTFIIEEWKQKSISDGPLDECHGLQ